MSEPVTYASFMIRVWRDPARESDAEEPAWAGEIESVQSGHIVQFRGVEALVELLVGRLTAPTDFLE